MDRQKKHAVRHMVIKRIYVSHLEKVVHFKMYLFSKNGPAYFYNVLFSHLRHVQKMGQIPAQLEWESVLSEPVVLSVSVESAMECQMRVNDMFCAVSRTDRDLRRKPSSAPHGRPTLRGPHVVSRAQPLQPPLRCRQRHQAPDFLAGKALVGHSSDGEMLLCRAHHNARKMF